MKQIKNPFIQSKQGDYNCFGCSPHNSNGLHLTFFEDGDQLISKWDPLHFLEGYHDVVHGGIQGTLMDEIGAWAIYIKCETAGVTSNMNVDFIKPLRISNGTVTLKAKLIEQTKRQAIMQTEIYDGENVLCAKGLYTYFIYPQRIATKRFGYPGIDAFY